MVDHAPGRTRRTAAAAAAALVGLTVMASPATAAPARDTSTACPSGTPDSGLSDLGGAFSRTAVNCAVAWDVVTGRQDRTYRPQATLTRAQTASLVARLVAASTAELPSDAPDAFDDDHDSVHEAAINALAAAGLVKGTRPATYDPDGSVTRGQLASLLARAEEYVLGDLPSAGDTFSDDDGSVHEEAINLLATQGVVSGISKTTFGPGLPVTRGQAALLVARLLDLLVDGDGTERPPFPLWDLAPGSAGPLTFRMSVAEMERVTGQPVEVGGDDIADGQCFTATPEAEPQLFSVVVPPEPYDRRGAQGLLYASFDADGPGARGVHVGDTRADVEAAFPEAVDPGPVVGQGPALDVYGGGLALRFIFRDDVVDTIQSGDRDTVDLYEGCA